MKLLKRQSHGVSHVLSFMLTFVIISLFVTSMLVTTSVLVSQKKLDAAKLEAQSIIDKVSNAVIECAAIKLAYPDADYVRTLDLPNKIVDMSYYIELTDKYIYLNSTNGDFAVKSITYNLDELNVGITGRIEPQQSGSTKIYCNKTQFVNKFDFGTTSSIVNPTESYTRVTDSCTTDDPPWPARYQGYMYRVPVFLSNPNTDKYSTVYNFAVRIRLDPTTFNYDHASPDGSDLRFYELATNKEIPYWIEQWNYGGRSIIWVNVSRIDHDNIRIIYLYYGNQSAPPASNGEETFLFFDDFSSAANSLNKWNFKNSNYVIADGYLKLFGDSAVVTKSYTLPEECRIMSVVQSSGDNIREANIFFRCQTQSDFYNSGYVFYSGNFSTSGKNLSIYKDGTVKICNASNDPGLDENWHKLIVSMWNNSVYNIYLAERYYYSIAYSEFRRNPMEYTYCTDPSYTDGYFGLCTTTSSNNFLTKYDWVAVQKMINNSIVYAVGGEDSINFWWDDVTILNSTRRMQTNNELFGDFVFSNGTCNPSLKPSNFYVKLLDTFYDDTNLTGYWSFEESKGSGSADKQKTIDRSGNKNDGTIYGATWTDGYFGSALSFDGANDYVKTDNKISMTSNVSFEAWLKPDFNYNDGKNHEWLYWSDGVSGGTYMHAYKNANNKIYFVIKGTTGWKSASDEIPFYRGEWHHFVGVYNSLKDELSLYWDGKLVVNTSGSGSLSTSASNYLFIGAQGTSSRFFKGIIDEVRIYDRVLSAEEIHEYYKQASDRTYSVSFASGDTDTSLSNVTVSSPQAIDGAQITVNSNPGKFVKKWFLINADSGIIDITIDDLDTNPNDFFWDLCMLTVEHGVKGVKGVKE